MLDPECIAHRSDSDCITLRTLAAQIIENGWKVPKWMIDKCGAELKALKKGWSNWTQITLSPQHTLLTINILSASRVNNPCVPIPHHTGHPKVGL